MTYSEMNVLLVDDETIFRKNLIRLLQNKGFSPEEAADGSGCLAFLAQHAVDVVVLDVKLPDINGIEVLKRIRQRENPPQVILLTGQATTEGGVAGIKAGAFDYLSKPVDVAHLITKITQAYDRILLRKEQRSRDAFRKQMEKRMQAAERLAALGTLAAGVGHEINNPLAIIGESAGWIRMLLAKAGAEDIPYRREIENALEKIEQSIDRARRITHQLLGLVRHHQNASAAVDPAALIEEVIQLAQRLSQRKKVDIRLKAPSAALKVDTDPFQLRQVLINLLTNAIDAAPEGGHVLIAVLRQAGEILLSVEDNGTGIPEEHRTKIFDPFFTTKGAGEGTGLGLFVSRRIVEQLGGRIDFKSRLGKGTVFYVRLPAGENNDIKGESAS